MTPQKSIYEVQIAGVTFKLKTYHDQNLVNEMIEFVNDKFEQCMHITRNTSVQNAAILTALNLAEELIMLKKNAIDQLEHIEKKAQKLSSSIESSQHEFIGMDL